MKNYTLFLPLFISLLLGCAPETMPSSLSLSSSSESISSLTSSSTLVSSTTSSSSDAMMPTLNTKWTIALNNIDPTLYYGETLPLTPSLSGAGVIEAVSVYTLEDATLYAYVFEALVNGNGGLIRFRVGIRLDLFTRFHVVSDSEHSTFGRRILNALTANLNGKSATYEAALNVLIQASLSRSGLSETFDGVMPAIDAIADFYQERNSSQ